MRLLPVLLTTCALAAGCPQVAPGDGGDDGGAARDDDDAGRAARDGGSGSDGGAVDGGVVVPEIVTDARINELDCRGHEWVELVTIGADVDLDGWSIGTDPSGDGAYALPAGITLTGGAYVVVEEDDPDAGLVGFTFAVSCGVETLYLFDAQGRVADVAPAADPAPDATSGRLPDRTGAFTTTAKTKGLRNTAVVDLTAALFDKTRVATIDLTLSAAAFGALQDEPYEYVLGTFAFAPGPSPDAGSPDAGPRDAGPMDAGADAGVGDGGAPDGGAADAGPPPLQVGVRLKGQIGSFRALPGKSGFKVDLDRLVEGQTFMGVDKLTLNNMVQDPSAVHEHLSYALFRALGVPAPRVGYAWVAVNGADYGLYSVVETYDDSFLARTFPTTAHVYEGSYGDDLFPNSEYAFDVDEGNAIDRADLAALIATINAAPDQGLLAATQSLVDWDEVLAMMAVEMLVGHWDGYAPYRNNYFFHVDDSGKFRLLPWGTDQTFANAFPLFEPQGVLLQRCLQDLGCRALYLQKLVDAADAADALNAAGEVLALAALLQPYADADPKNDWSGSLQELGDDAVAFLSTRVDEIRAAAACEATTPDTDGDGAVCTAECAPNDPAIHVGAVDVCGDSVDQDCNGRTDDGPGCPDCPTAGYDGKTYAFCWGPRSQPAARANCQALGMDLVVIDDMDEDGFVVGQAGTRGLFQPYIGATDVADEGTFLWIDGAALVYTNWSPGEPNDYMAAEDCAALLDVGLWNDVNCDSLFASICESQ